MRRTCLAIAILLACKSGGSEPAADDPKEGKADAAKADETKPDDGDADDEGNADEAEDDGGSSSGGVEPVPIDVDDANRFVKEDLDRFLGQYPQALRKQDAELFATCVRAQCLEHGVSKTVTPFSGAGVRYLVPLWLRGCLSGSAEACMNAGRTYQSSELAGSEQPVHEDWKKEELRARFRMYIDRACKLDDTECEQWADYMLGDEAAAAKDVQLAIQRLEKGCSRKEYGSCAALARHAPDHSAIGDEIEWWRQACEHDPNVPSRECARYASSLIATGDKANLAEAVTALGPTCDPTSKVWKKECKGDPETGQEACDWIYIQSHGNACITLAPTLPDEQALRLDAAMCVGSIVDETNLLMKQACERATKLATKLGRSSEYLAAIAHRACEVEYHVCLSETFDIDACSDKRDACQTKAAG